MTDVQWSRRKLVSILMIVFMVVAAATGISWYNLGRASRPQSNAAVLDTIADWNGNMKDAFVNPSNPSSNTIYVPVGVSVLFTINNLDSAQNTNFSAVATPVATIPFTV